MTDSYHFAKANAQNQIAASNALSDYLNPLTTQQRAQRVEWFNEYFPRSPRQQSIGPFPSGAVLQVVGDKIVGREEPPFAGDFPFLPKQSTADCLRGALDKLAARCEPKRPALTWRTETPFDPFKGFVADTVYSGYVDWPAAQNHPLQRLNDGGPVNGSASLLKTA